MHTQNPFAAYSSCSACHGISAQILLGIARSWGLAETKGGADNR